MKRAAVATVETVAGPFTIVVADEAVIASGWTSSVDEVLEPVAANLRPEHDREAPRARTDHCGGSSLQRR